MNQLFFNLTPEIVLKAAEDGYTPTGHCLALNSLENRVYDITLEDDSHIVVKFYRPGRWTHEQIQEEHDFLFELQQAEIPVCAPLRFPDGSTLRETEGIFYAHWPRTGGRMPDELHQETLLILGRLLARIHNRGSASEAVHRLRLTSDLFIHKPLDILIQGEFLPRSVRERFQEAALRTAEVYDSLSESVPFHRIHGDCHKGNLLFGNDGWFFLDFDDFLTGPAVQDIWMIAPGGDSWSLQEQQILLESYNTFRDFDPAWLRLIEPLRTMRYVHYASWIARRWDDPAFPEAFPHFGTETYWENETRDLEQQVNGFRKEQLFSFQSEREEPVDEELSNSDFFWDWEDPKKDSTS